MLQGANYSVLAAVTQLDATNLRTNIGFYFGLGYWGSFILFALLLLHLDRRQLGDSSNFNQRLFHFIKEAEQQSEE